MSPSPRSSHHLAIAGPDGIRRPVLSFLASNRYKEHNVYLETLDDLFDVANFAITLTDKDTIRIVGTNRRTGNDFSVEADTTSEAVDEAISHVTRETWFVQDILDDYNITIEQLRDLIGLKQPVDLDDAINAAWENGYHAGSIDAANDFWAASDAEMNAVWDNGYMLGLNEGRESVRDYTDEMLDARISTAWEDGYEAGRYDEHFMLADQEFDAGWLTADDFEIEDEIAAADAYEAWLMSQGINAAMPTFAAAAQSFDDWTDDDERWFDDLYSLPHYTWED